MCVHLDGLGTVPFMLPPRTCGVSQAIVALSPQSVPYSCLEVYRRDYKENYPCHEDH